MGMSPNKFATYVLAVADKPTERAELATGLATVAAAHSTTSATLREGVAELESPNMRVDLVVIDLELAGGGAVTLTRKIRDPRKLGRRNLAILLVGGATNTPHYKSAVRLGIQGHLPRPFTNEQLRAALRAALAARPMDAPKAETEPVKREAKAVEQKPEKPAPYEPVPDAPVANKPFMYGLQMFKRTPKPFTADDGFGLEPATGIARPKRQLESVEVTRDEIVPPCLRIAVA